MIYNLKERWGFIHIKKTAGTSINNELRQKKDVFVYPNYTRYGSQEFFLDMENHHQSVKFYKSIPLFKNLKYYAVVRNPYDRLVSCYYFQFFSQVNIDRHLKDNDTNYNLYVNTLLKNKQLGFNNWVEYKYKNWNNPINNYEGKFGTKEDIMCNYIDNETTIFKFEDLSKVESVFNIDIHHLNKSEHRHWRDEYKSQETLDMVYEMYSEDFKRFKYDKE
jgi:hypothetical protein